MHPPTATIVEFKSNDFYIDLRFIAWENILKQTLTSRPIIHLIFWFLENECYLYMGVRYITHFDQLEG